MVSKTKIPFKSMKSSLSIPKKYKNGKTRPIQHLYKPTLTLLSWGNKMPIPIEPFSGVGFKFTLQMSSNPPLFGEDNPKLLDGSGEVPKTKRHGWRFVS